jgi:uncharacterized protein YkwD
MDKRLWVVGAVGAVIIVLALLTPNGPASAATQGISGSSDTPEPQDDATPTAEIASTSSPMRISMETSSVTRTRTATPGGKPDPSTPTVSPASGQATPAATPTETPTPTAVPELDINRTRLERLIQQEINEYRLDNDLGELMLEGTTAGEIKEMARDHAGDLRADGEVWQLTNEVDIPAIYEEHELYRQCRFRKADAQYIVTADDGQLMAVQSLDASSEDEELIARNVMDNWADSRFHAEKFDYQNADIVGVGVALDHATDEAYVVMSMC